MSGIITRARRWVHNHWAHKLRRAINDYSDWRSTQKCKRLYPDFKEKSEYDNGEFKFIWGVKSLDDLCQTPACLYTMNDIDIIYSREKKRYILSIETAYWFETQEAVVAYLQSLLRRFAEYMDEQGYDKSAPYTFWMSQPSILLEEETIPELYTSFKIFVEGYTKVYNENKVV